MSRQKLKIIAIISAYNEGDIIYHTIRHLVEDDIDVYFIDNNSSDNTVREVEKWLGKGVIHIERFPDDGGYSVECKNTYVWSALLQRKEELHQTLNGDWYLHHDADEIRGSSWAGVSLREGIELVDKLGFNCIDFACLNFKPVDNSFMIGADVQEYLLYYDILKGHKQVKCWKNIGQGIDLVSTGGHEVLFLGRNIFPIKFIMRHYPIRSQDHGVKKVYVDRLPRYSEAEKSKGWHTHYKQCENNYLTKFLYDPEDLTKYDPSEVQRIALIQSMAEHVQDLEILSEKCKQQFDYLKELERRITHIEQSNWLNRVKKGFLKFYKRK